MFGHKAGDAHVSPLLYKTWLPFLVVTTILTLAAGRHVDNFAGEPDQLDSKFFGIWAWGLGISWGRAR